jgi:hypothetical protein
VPAAVPGGSSIQLAACIGALVGGGAKNENESQANGSVQAHWPPESAAPRATGGVRILAGVKRLPALPRRKVGEKPLLPREVDDKLVPAHWRKAVYANAELPQGAVDREAYVVCVLEQLFRALKRRDIFASPSHR